MEYCLLYTLEDHTGSYVNFLIPFNDTVCINTYNVLHV